MPPILDQETPENDAASVAVAKEVVRRFEGVDLGEEYILQRSYGDWDLELKNVSGLPDNSLDQLHVDVVAHTTEQELMSNTRGSVQFRLPVDIALRRRIRAYQQQQSTGRVLVEEIDKYILATQKVAMLFHQERMTSFEAAAYDNSQPTRILTAPHLDLLKKSRQFCAILRITFLVSLRFQVGV